MKYTLIRSRRRHRRLALKLTPSGEVKVYAPLHTPKFFIDRFVNSKTDWIQDQRQKLASYIPPKPHFKSETKLKQFISKQLQHYSKLLQLYPTEVRFKQVKSYWGNCHSSGRLTFNLNLIYAPHSAVEYVVVHELVHLKYKGHTKKFWNLVNQTYPHTKSARKILRGIRLE